MLQRAVGEAGGVTANRRSGITPAAAAEQIDVEQLVRPKVGGVLRLERYPNGWGTLYLDETPEITDIHPDVAFLLERELEEAAASATDQCDVREATEAEGRELFDRKARELLGEYLARSSCAVGMRASTWRPSTQA